VTGVLILVKGEVIRMPGKVNTNKVNRFIYRIAVKMTRECAQYYLGYLEKGRSGDLLEPFHWDTGGQEAEKIRKELDRLYLAQGGIV
jgi:hypothetical protein